MKRRMAGPTLVRTVIGAILMILILLIKLWYRFCSFVPTSGEYYCTRLCVRLLSGIFATVGWFNSLCFRFLWKILFSFRWRMRSLSFTKPSRWWQEESRGMEVQDTSSRRQRLGEQEPYTPVDILKKQDLEI